MKLLALETTGPRLGACLWEDGRVKALKDGADNASHAQALMPLVDGLFARAGWAPADLDAVAVDVGPGRFTGLRIGVSAARTLGLALEKPVVDVVSLEAMAAQGSGWEVGKNFAWKFPHDLLCVLADARRDDVYMAVWRFHQAGDGRRGSKALHTFGHHFKLVHAPTLFPFARFLSFFQSCFQAQDILFCGSAVAPHQAALRKAFGGKVRLAPASELDVRYVAALGAEKFYRREYKPFNQVQPLYLRPSYAEEAAAAR